MNGPSQSAPAADAAASARLRRLAGLATLLAVAQFAVIFTLAVRFYPGGNVFDWQAPGHSFWLNTLSDLGKPTAANGQPNPVWSIAFSASLLAVFLALAPMWLAMPALFGRSVRLGAAVAVLGVLSVVGGVVIGVSLAAGQPAAHAVGIALASIPGLSALAISCLGLLLAGRRALAGMSIVLLAVGLVHFGQYVAHFWLGMAWTEAAPATQKVAVIWALAWMTAIGAGVLRKPVRPSGPAGRAAAE